MSLAAMALDKPRPRGIVIETLLQYIPTDPVFCRAEPGDLAEKQAELLDPVLRWLEKEIEIPLHSTSSIFGVEFSCSDTDKLRHYIDGKEIYLGMQAILYFTWI